MTKRLGQSSSSSSPPPRSSSSGKTTASGSSGSLSRPSVVRYLGGFVMGAFIIVSGFITQNRQLLCITAPISGAAAAAIANGELSSQRTTISTSTTSAADPSSSLLLSYELAKSQSFGFFDDVPDKEWTQIRQRVKNVHPNTNGDPYVDQWAGSNIWYQSHYEPNFACRHENRIGRLGDGGKWVCDPHRLKNKQQQQEEDSPPPPCLVYSIGSNGDPSFEQSVQQEIGPHCEIHIFDMDDYAEKVLTAVPVNAHYHQWGLSTRTNLVPNPKGHVYKSLNDTMAELGHLNRPVDIFKIDCEGCEWEVYQDFFLPGIDLRQILIELHASKKPSFRGGALYKKVHLPATPDFFKAMERHYVIFHKEPNIQWSVGAAAIEYAFLKLDTPFFQGIVDEG
mmetsp:Transcript_57073/g.139062  ORF Transcript_57073/g.139062 Transcript_57073/m.139062 type:complete len:394 (-) Transcript_57073:44-1225(-)